MKDVMLIVLAVVAVYSLLSWAAAPAAVFNERSRADVLQVRVDVDATTIARLQPTATPSRVRIAPPFC